MKSHDIDTHVGHRILTRRTRLGLTQTELGAQIGVTQNAVGNYEKAACRVSASKLYAIAHALDVPVSYFFQELDQPEPDTLAGLTAMERTLIFAYRDSPASIRQTVLSLVKATAGGTIDTIS